ncbi:PEP-CTERM sorting domain-containing protein [Phycisphaeraceae bacterium D3-23]
MMIRKATTAVMMMAALALAGSASASLVNAGFETDDTSGGDTGTPTGWQGFNNNFTSSQSAPAFEGVNVVKMFGPFGGIGEASGIFQDVAASAGDNVVASVQAQNWSGDALGGNNFGAINIEFYDAAGAQLEVAFGDQIVAGSTQDVWMQLDASGVAPAGTTTARLVLLHVQNSDPVAGGSVFYDAASITVPEPGSLALLGLGGLALLRRRR